jgi:hypothetical protein
VRNNNSSFQLISITIQKINIPGIEKINVKINTSINAPGQLYNSFENKVTQDPLNNALSNAAKTQMVNAVKIDLKNFIF